MRLETALEQITALGPLKTVARSIDVFDTTKSTLDQLRELLVDTLTKKDVVTKLWDELTMREKFVLLSFIEDSGSKPILIKDAFKLFKAYSDRIHEEAKSIESFEDIDPKIISAYAAGVQIALKDERITTDERAVLDAFREGLGITHHQELLIYTKLDLFKDINEKSLAGEIAKIICKLGLMFEIGTGMVKNYPPSFVIPYEIVREIKEILGFGISDHNYAKFLSKVNSDILKKMFAASKLPKTSGDERIIKRIITYEFPIQDLLKALDIRELRTVSYSAGFKPIVNGKTDLINFLAECADVDDLEDLPPGVYLDESLSEEKVLSLVKCWKASDKQSLEVVLKDYLIPISQQTPALAKRILESGVPVLDLLNHPKVNSECVSAIVACLGERVMNRKSDNLKKISVYLNDADRNLISYINQVAKRDIVALDKKGFAYNNDEIPNLFEKLTKYVFDSSFNYTVERHPILKSIDGQELQPDGVINLDGNRVVLWENKASREEYVLTTKGRRPHYDQFKNYIDAFKKTYPEKQLIAFMVVTSSISASALKELRRLKEATNCDVCILSSKNLSLIYDFAKCADDKIKNDLNLFNRTGEITEKRIKERLKV